MDYSPSFSGSNEYYAKSALVDNFGYSEDILLRARNLYEDSEWKKLLCEDLDKGWPIIYSSGGHTFVVDGYDEKGNFHANMGFGPSGGNRYYTIDELGKRSNSTALVHIHPADDGKEEPLLIIFLKDATSVKIPCKAELAERVGCSEASVYNWQQLAEFREYYHQCCEKRFRSYEGLAIKKLVENADKGNQKAIEYLLNYIGYKPVEQQEMQLDAKIEVDYGED